MHLTRTFSPQLSTECDMLVKRAVANIFLAEAAQAFALSSHRARTRSRDDTALVDVKWQRQVLRGVAISSPLDRHLLTKIINIHTSSTQSIYNLLNTRTDWRTHFLSPRCPHTLIYTDCPHHCPPPPDPPPPPLATPRPTPSHPTRPSHHLLPLPTAPYATPRSLPRTHSLP